MRKAIQRCLRKSKQTVVYRDALAFITLAALIPAHAVYAQSAACAPGESAAAFSFSSVAWTPGDLGPNSFTVGSSPNQITLTVTASGTGFLTGAAITPRILSRGGLPTALALDMNQPGRGFSVQLRVGFSRPVSKLRYFVGDIDSAIAYDDLVTLSASNGVAPVSVAPTALNASNVTVTGNQATGVIGRTCANTSPDCQIRVDQSASLDSVLVDFASGPRSVNNDPTVQRLGVDNFSFCVANPRADLTVTKQNGVNSVVAGTDTLYTLVVNNNGPAAADGAILRDIPDSKLACTSLTCSEAGGALCPAGATTAQLLTGLTLPTLPNGGVLTFQLTCGVVP